MCVKDVSIWVCFSIRWEPIGFTKDSLQKWFVLLWFRRRVIRSTQICLTTCGNRCASRGMISSTDVNPCTVCTTLVEPLYCLTAPPGIRGFRKRPYRMLRSGSGDVRTCVMEVVFPIIRLWGMSVRRHFANVQPKGCVWPGELETYSFDSFRYSIAQRLGNGCLFFIRFSITWSGNSFVLQRFRQNSVIHSMNIWMGTHSFGKLFWTEVWKRIGLSMHYFDFVVVCSWSLLYPPDCFSWMLVDRSCTSLQACKPASLQACKHVVLPSRGKLPKGFCVPAGKAQLSIHLLCFTMKSWTTLIHATRCSKSLLWHHPKCRLSICNQTLPQTQNSIHARSMIWTVEFSLETNRWDGRVLWRQNLVFRVVRDFEFRQGKRKLLSIRYVLQWKVAPHWPTQRDAQQLDYDFTQKADYRFGAQKCLNAKFDTCAKY